MNREQQLSGLGVSMREAGSVGKCKEQAQGRQREG